MTETRCATPIEFADIADYWSGELSSPAADRIEEHVFTCAECARRLSEVEALTRGVADLVRAGRFHSAVTDAVLNQLARDGVRIREYTLGPGDVVPCAIWADDDLIVTRIRADFTGVDAVTVVKRLASGREAGRLEDLPVRPGQIEILDATSAALLKRLPATTLRVTLTGRTAGGERVLAEYVLEHAGTLDRAHDSSV